MRCRRLPVQSGFTIIEVLIAAVIFMIGFSLLMSLLSSTILRFSTKEILAATNTAQQVMLYAVSASDTTSCDTVLENSGIRFRVIRQATVTGGLACMQVAVYRLKRSDEIIRLYDEFTVSEK
jgi:Tfp pilus assembly protein PilV